MKALSKMFIGTNWVTDKDITTGLQTYKNKRTKAKEPEGIRGKKDRHKTGNTQETDNMATIQCVKRDFTLKNLKLVKSSKPSLNYRHEYNFFFSLILKQFKDGAFLISLDILFHFLGPTKRILCWYDNVLGLGKCINDEERVLYLYKF